MYTFDQAIQEATKAGYLPLPIVARLLESPIYIQDYGDQEIAMPSVEAWKNWTPMSDFQRVLPARVTRTIQVCKALRGFSIYSILLSDGVHLAAYKFLAKDAILMLSLQTAQIDGLMAQLRTPGQPIAVVNKCYSVRPVPNEISPSQEGIRDLLKTLWISTLHFIHGHGVQEGHGYKKMAPAKKVAPNAGSKSKTQNAVHPDARLLLAEQEEHQVGDWFAIGTLFAPCAIQYEGRPIAGIRQLLCIDVTSHYIMDSVGLMREPDVVTAKDVLYFVTKVMTEQGMPRKGFIVLKSTYLSSHDLADDEQTQRQGAFLASIGVSFPAMTEEDKATFQERMSIVTLKAAFQGLSKIEADVDGLHKELAGNGRLDGGSAVE